MPLTWAISLLFGSIFSKKKKRKRHLLADAIFILVLFSNPLFVDSTMNWLEEDVKEFHNISKHDIAIVLTGVANIKKEPSDRVYFNKGADRIYHAVVLYRKGKVNKILVTGGNIDLTDRGEDSEADILKSYLLNSGIPERDIIIESKAKNTRQNATNVKKLLENRNLSDKKLLLITSAYHMKRSKWCFDKVGLQVTTFPADFYSSDSISWESFLPSQYALHKTSVILHELFGMATYKIMGYI